MNVAVCAGLPPLAGRSRALTDISKRILVWLSPSALESSRTCIHAFLKLVGLELRGYRPPFISCMVRKITLRLFFLTSSKNCLYCVSNFPAATSAAVNQLGEMEI